MFYTPLDFDRRIDHLVRQLLQRQPPDLRPAGYARRKRTPPNRSCRSDRVRGRVELQHVRSATTRAGPCCSDISFTIAAGRDDRRGGAKRLGKSTLVSLIARLVRRGPRADPHRRRRRAAASIRGNSAGRSAWSPRSRSCSADRLPTTSPTATPQAAPEQILLAAKQADAHDFIMRMPLAYSTQLGEGGSGLSGGERQRLSIARALLFDPAILILDEATASVDAESERAICRAIRRWARRRTAIVIAHRLSTLQDADRLLVFDQGRLIEQGTQQELLSRGGLYSTLLRLQCNLHEGRPHADPAFGADAMSGVETMLAYADGDEVEFPSLPSLSPNDRAALAGHGGEGENGDANEQRAFAGSIPPPWRLPTARRACSA